jgi:RNA-directed DNA polymerase
MGVKTIFDMIDYKTALVQWLASERQRVRSKKLFKKGFIGGRLYPHFDAPLNLDSNPRALGLLLHRLSSPTNIMRWPFFPFILQNRRMRQYRHNDRSLPPVVKSNQKLHTHIKSRPIMTSAHKDACLFSLFSYIFTPYYETFLTTHALDTHVVAYRSISGKNNVDFARKAYDYMHSQPELGCLLIDIKGFFDNIDHRQLENSLCTVLECESLPSEIQYVFDNLTRYRYAHEDKIYSELKRNGRKYLVPVPGTKHSKKICKIEDYNKYIDNGNVVKTNTSSHGIPQGTPISGILANISLISFDLAVSRMLASYPIHFYQRYSDDIVVVCPKDEIEGIYRFLLDELNKIGLKASTKKTEAFIKKADTITNVVSLLEPKASARRQNIQYLGLEWTGKQILLRPSTIARRLRPGNPRIKKPQLWKYHNITATKLENGTPIRKQFYRIRGKINKKYRSDPDKIPN